jgi:hypothetical protein
MARSMARILRPRCCHRIRSAFQHKRRIRCTIEENINLTSTGKKVSEKRRKRVKGKQEQENMCCSSRMGCGNFLLALPIRVIEDRGLHASNGDLSTGQEARPRYRMRPMKRRIWGFHLSLVCLEGSRSLNFN